MRLLPGWLGLLTFVVSVPCFSDRSLCPSKPIQTFPSKYTELVSIIQLRSEPIEFEAIIAVKAPEGGSWYKLKEPDTAKNGPRKTTLVLHRDKDSLVQIEVRDHISGGVHAKWNADQSLDLEFWPGRIMESHAEIDPSKGKILRSFDLQHVEDLSCPDSDT